MAGPAGPQGDVGFEISVGGKTSASIFFDENMAQHVKEQQFDQVYGAQQGRRFRAGQSVDTYARPMDEVENQLHPHLRNIVKQQYKN